MKTQFLSLILALLIAGSSALKAQDWPEEYLGLPGDNLNLYAVMNIFQNSETLEGFERDLNNPDKMINNLDLNGDGYVDYIMVYNYVDGNIHQIVLRVALNNNEQQDVAVFMVEKLRTGAVQIQLIGDEALYGSNYIIEPNYDETPNPGYTGTVTKQRVKTRNNVTVVRTTYYEVASWPVIVYIYRPSYVVWRSPWHWGYYPNYWYSWTPHYWHYYYGYHYNYYTDYYTYYRPWNHYRCGNYRTVYYTSIRNYSPTVVVNVNRGVYKNTYSRPETRREGELVYERRRSDGNNLPTGRTSVGSAEGRQSSRPAAEVNTRTNRSANEGRPAGVGRETQTRSETRQINEGNRGRTETVGSGRNDKSREVQREATPRRETTAAPDRPATRSSGDQVRTSAPGEQTARPESSGRSSSNNSTVASPEREKSKAPARNVERSAPERSSSSKQSAPTVNQRENTRSSSVERSQPPRSENKTPANVRSSEQKSSRNSDREVKSNNTRNQKSSGETETSSKRSRVK